MLAKQKKGNDSRQTTFHVTDLSLSTCMYTMAEGRHKSKETFHASKLDFGGNFFCYYCLA